MRTLRSCLVSVGLFLLSSAVAPVEAQTVAAGPYYATPSWDQTIACTASASCPRFIVLSNFNNAAVLDRETGLVWDRNPSSAFLTFEQAHIGCLVKVIGNRQGWRVPTIEELRTLMDPSNFRPALPLGHPFNTAALAGPFLDYRVFFWSSTRNPPAFGSDQRLGVSIDNAAARVTFGGSNSLAGVWCVRGPGSVAP